MNYCFEVSEPDYFWGGADGLRYGCLRSVRVTLRRDNEVIAEKRVRLWKPFLQWRIKRAKRKMLKVAVLLVRQRTDVLITPSGAQETQRG